MNVSSCMFVVFQCKNFPTNNFPYVFFFLVEYLCTWIVCIVVINIFYLPKYIIPFIFEIVQKKSKFMLWDRNYIPQDN